MKAKSSIHLAPGASGYLAHNSRESPSRSQVFFDEKNEVWHDKKEAFEIYKKELAARSDAYSKRTKQKLQKNAITHYSAIINLNENHTLTDLKPLIRFLEKRLDTKIFQVGLHRDEGKLIHKKSGLKLVSGKDFFANPKDKKLYYDEQFKKPINMDYFEAEKNYHVHIEMMGIDSKGKAIKRNRLSRSFLKELQTFTAKSLQMERGKEVEPYSKNQMLEIKAQLKDKSEYANSREFGIAFNKVARELGYFKKKTKRLDTHEKKAKAKIENDAEKKAYIKNQKLTKEANATISAVKAEANELKKELQTLTKKLIREDWAKYEAEVKTLKAEAKAKELTVPDLNSRMKKLRAKFIAPVLEAHQNRKNEIVTLKEEIKELKAEVVTQSKAIKAKDAEIVKFKGFQAKFMTLFYKYVKDFNEKKTPDAVLNGLDRAMLGFKAQVATLTNQLKLHALKSKEEQTPVAEDPEIALLKEKVEKPFREMREEYFPNDMAVECINDTLKDGSSRFPLSQSERTVINHFADYFKRKHLRSIDEKDFREFVKGDFIKKIIDVKYPKKQEREQQEQRNVQKPKQSQSKGLYL